MSNKKPSSLHPKQPSHHNLPIQPTTKRCKSRSSRPSVSSVDKKVLPLTFFAALRGPSWIKVLMLQLPFSVALRVLRGKRCCRCSCRSSRPFADKKVLPLTFFAVLRGPSWIKVLMLQLPFSVALRVLRGKRCCRCSCRSSRPFADKKVLPLTFFVALRGPSWIKVLMLTFSVALRVLRGKRFCRCSCRTPRPFADKKVLPLTFFAALRGP